MQIKLNDVPVAGLQTISTVTTTKYTCSASGLPSPTFSWVKVVDGSADMAETSSDTLTFGEDSPGETEAKYKCIATNTIDSIEHPEFKILTITVEGN